MKRFFSVMILAVCFCAVAGAQIQSDYLSRYNRLVSRVGFCGVGVETLLDNWRAADSTDVNLQVARFNYFFAKSEKEEVITSAESKYLGQKPVMALKDSLGRPVNFFTVKVYDPENFSKAVACIDRAIELANSRWDVALVKARALNSFEGGDPELTLTYLCGLVDKHYGRKYKWDLPSGEVDDTMVENVMQDFCYDFYLKGTESSYNAFKVLSEKVLKYRPKNVNFLNNVGTYYLVCRKDLKNAQKYYSKVLKLAPDDETALANMKVLERYRQQANTKKK